MSTASLVRSDDTIESPVPGRWPLGVAPVVTVGGQRAGEVSGALVVGPEPRDVRIELAARAADGTRLAVTASLVDGDIAGRWTLAGDVTAGGRAAPVAVEACYRGVYRRASHAWAEVSFVAATGGPSSPTIDADVIFDAPEGAVTR